MQAGGEVDERDHFALCLDRSRVGIIDVPDDAQQSALAAAVTSDDAEYFPPINLEGDGIEDEDSFTDFAVCHPVYDM